MQEPGQFFIDKKIFKFNRLFFTLHFQLEIFCRSAAKAAPYGQNLPKRAGRRAILSFKRFPDTSPSSLIRWPLTPIWMEKR
jgi:hypothetical protein